MQRLGLLLVMLLLGTPALGGDGGELTTANDLDALGQQAKREGKPLVVFFYQEQCHYCETVRKLYLEPMQRDGSAAERIILRKIDTRGDAKITDFNGNKVRQQGFAHREEKTFTPTIAFYGPNGERLTRSLVGLKGGRDYYGHYLEKGISEAESALQEML
jgi:thioredoxin-related protein